MMFLHVNLITFSWAIIRLDQPCVIPSIRQDLIVLPIWEIASSTNCKVKNKKNYSWSVEMYSNYGSTRAYIPFTTAVGLEQNKLLPSFLLLLFLH